MRGSFLRLVSVVLLLVVGGLSTTRAICVLPCLSEPAGAAVSSSHCDHAGSEPVTTIDAHSSACDSCGDVAIDRADRLSLRNSTVVWLAASASVSVPHVFDDTFDLVGDAGPPPGVHLSTTVSLPLRI